MHPSCLGSQAMEGSETMKLIEHIAVKPAHNTRNIEQVICQRCSTGEARYHVFSDIINIKVCASCAKMAKKLATFTDGDSLNNRILTGEISIRLWPNLLEAKQWDKRSNGQKQNRPG